MTVRYGHIKAYLIGVSHADIALVLARHVTVDGINIFRADQLIHWNVNTHTHRETYKSLTCIPAQSYIHKHQKASLKAERQKQINFPSLIQTHIYLYTYTHRWVRLCPWIHVSGELSHIYNHKIIMNNEKENRFLTTLKMLLLFNYTYIHIINHNTHSVAKLTSSHMTFRLVLHS